jgi:hypothetical protein
MFGMIENPDRRKEEKKNVPSFFLLFEKTNPMSLNEGYLKLLKEVLTEEGCLNLLEQDVRCAQARGELPSQAKKKKKVRELACPSFEEVACFKILNSILTLVQLSFKTLL